MTRGWLLVVLRAIPVGWAVMWVLGALGARAVLRWMGPWVGAAWISTAELGLNCAVLVATGWVVGRVSRPRPMIGVLVFAATLVFWDLSDWVGINVPWLIRLVADTYWSSVVSTGATQALLFACLIGGGLLSRARETPVSIAR